MGNQRIDKLMITFRLRLDRSLSKFLEERCRITQHNLGEVIAQTEIVIIRMMCGSVCNTVVPSKEDRRAAYLKTRFEYN